MTEISASVLNADISKWAGWLPGLEKAGVDRIQFDIMDNRFVSNTGVPKRFVGELRPATKLFFESHLMVQRPQDYIMGFADMGCDMLIFHVEAAKKPEGIIREIHDHGMGAGIALNNKTGVEKIMPHLEKADLALVMGVEAGLGGQKFNHSAIEKISDLRKKIASDSLSCQIGVDGGINPETAKKCVKAGADVLVAGTFIFSHPKGIAQAVRELRNV